MSLQAIDIIKEEITRAKENTPYVRHTLLEALQFAIVARVVKECVEQDIPAAEYCRFCGQTEEGCTGSGMDDGIPAHDFDAGRPLENNVLF